MLLRKIKRLSEEFKLYWSVFQKKALIVRYYNKILNVGDDLNQDIIEHYSGKKAVNPIYSNHLPHILMVGSVIDGINKNSTVLGSGLICKTRLNSKIEARHIAAVRGPLTLKEINKWSTDEFDVPLGDFALLMPRIYSPLKEKTHRFGLVLHYVDENHPIKETVLSMGGRIINVRQKAKSFIDEITSCEAIISSSMHGLILSDAYKIPNKWLVLSDGLIGGDFKFNDYYATTDGRNESPCKVGNLIKPEDIDKVLLETKVNRYVHDLDKLEKLLIEQINKVI
ncbi:hypothetical protein BCV02_05050 [Vibrio breoganii]|uniref:polysaccharide pyruvyl transferase family protein n=1 Tax=Vibrio breoganii TaxID=553239 RepID=UPI000C84FA23|nr:polysaccharide pyruvyl transferase family protein [Vibrio breoganii]PMG05093.1 hypothetical protein BCV02_05050 [Vibrio breoganii]